MYLGLQGGRWNVFSALSAGESTSRMFIKRVLHIHADTCTRTYTHMHDARTHAHTQSLFSLSGSLWIYPKSENTDGFPRILNDAPSPSQKARDLQVQGLKPSAVAYTCKSQHLRS